MTKLSIVCFIVLCAAGANAQQAAPTATAASTPPVLPPGPLLKPIPDHIRWTVTAAGKIGSDAKPEEKAAASTITMGEVSGKTAHVVTFNTRAGKEEKWTDGQLLATLQPGAREPFFTTTSIERIPMPAWISAENISEIKTVGEKSYLIFRARIVPSGTEAVIDLEHPDQGAADQLKVDAMATIDGDTRLPLAVKEGEVTSTYKYEPLALDTQIIPAAMQAAFAEREKKMRDLVRKPVRP